ncbi:hypothetical protein Tco_1429645 [Tanacetum coccineum]
MTTLADKSLLSGGDNKPPMLEKHLLGLPGHSNLFEVHHHYVLSSDDLDAYDSDCDELIRQDCSHGQSLKDMAQMHSLRYKETVKIEEMENVEQFFRWSKKEPLPQLSLRAWGIVDVKKPFIKMEQAVAQHAWRPELSKLKMNQLNKDCANPPSSTPFVPPSRSDWDLLFQPMFDESLSPPPNVDLQAPEVIAPIPEAVAPEHAMSTRSSSSTTVVQGCHPTK